MAIYQVGKPYDPSVRRWPEAGEYNTTDALVAARQDRTRGGA